jgi:hypothetical protein
MSRRVPVIIAFSILLFTSCTSSKKTTQKSGNARSSYCQNVPYEKEPAIGWQKATLPDMTAHTDVHLPKAYDSYMINDADLKAFFVYAGQHKQKNSFSIPLPKPLGCQYFDVEDAGTMAPGLQAKYPDIVSLKGNGTNTKSGSIRLNYDGVQMRAEVNWNGSIYYVMPVKTDGNIIYLVYDKRDSGETKEPFEQKTDPAKATPASPAQSQQKQMLQNR